MKNNRLDTIIKIISENEIETQEALQAALQEHGYEVTQGTISRDIRELGLIKSVSETGVTRYVKIGYNDRQSQYEGIFPKSVINVDYAMNTVVVKCHSGLAGAACAVLDSMEINSVVGTIAGDDTIFILTRDEKYAKSLAETLTELIINEVK